MAVLNGIRKIIFDLDGTLVDSSEGVTRATNYALEKLGERARSVEEVSGFIGYPLEDMFSAFSGGSYEEFWKHFQEIGRTVIAEATVPIGNADGVLRELSSRGFRLGIGTTKRRIHVAAILRNLGWEELIETYIGADDVKRVKPAPECFERVMENLGGNSIDCLCVGDTINDVLAAKGAGLKIVAVKSVFGREEELIEGNPDYLIERLDELPDLLG